MKNVKWMIFTASFVFTAVAQIAFAEETMSEKAQAGANNTRRALKKGAHRVQEAVCLKGDLRCGAQKAENRVIEAKDATVDGVKELKNKVN